MSVLLAAVAWSAWSFTSSTPTLFRHANERHLSHVRAALRAFSFQTSTSPLLLHHMQNSSDVPFESFALNCLSTSSGTHTPPPQGSRTAYRAVVTTVSRYKQASVQSRLQAHRKSVRRDNAVEGDSSSLRETSPMCLPLLEVFEPFFDILVLVCRRAHVDSPTRSAESYILE